MPTLQQVGESLPRPDTPRLDYHRFMDSSVNEGYPRSSESESLMSIAELLGLNMPRGTSVGGGSLGSYGQGESAPASPLLTGSSSRQYSVSGDDSGYQTSHPGSPLPVDMSTSGKSSVTRRGRLDSAGAFPPASPAPSQSSQGPFSPGSGPSTRPFRAGSHTLSESGSSIGTAFMMNSRATSPESNSSLNSLDNPNLSDLMSCLYLHARNRSDSGLSAGLPSNDEHGQQGLTNLANLHVLQTLSNNPSLNFYQHNQQLQSPLSSPVSSPVAGPDKSWSPGSRSNSLSSSLPGSPLCMSSPLRGPSAPKTPTSPGASPSRFHRSPVSSEADATCTWSGKLPPRSVDNASISVKVFIGGVPWDINDAMLVHAFRHFGSIRVEWPTSKQPGVPPPKGYAYIIFECEKQVKALLQACSYSFSDGEGHWFFKVSSKRMKAKVVQVIPWTSSDTNWVLSPSQKLDPEKTVFVGGLHGMLNAHGLAQIMDDLFDGVVYAGIDTDKFKYPIGSARVTFINNRSFFKAINARFIEIKTDKFTKKVQLDPYLEDAPCSICSVQHGPYFCREISCFRYYCRSCWHWRHSQDNSLVPHKYLMRSSKSHNAVTDGMGLTMNFSLGLRGQNRRELAYL